MTERTISTARGFGRPGDPWPAVGAELRTLIVGGIPVGVAVAGVGSRVAMFVLRLTSSDRVVGVTSDDGFTIGRVTLSGTYNLLLIGAAVGLIGAGAYRVVARWLLGPMWFRRLTLGLASAVVVGSMLVHHDGVDFTLLQPSWLAVGLFVALPGLFGLLIGPAVEAAADPGSWTAAGRRRWLIPLVLLVCFPPTLVIAGVITAVLVVLAALSQVTLLQRLRSSAGYALAIRCVWLSIAIAGLVALAGDIEAIV